MTNSKNSLLLLSGGLDSAANFAIGSERNEIVRALTFKYGQRAQAKELQAAIELCQYYRVEHQVLDLSWLGALGGSALTDKNQSLPRLNTHELDQLDIIKKTAKAVWVPNRNGIFINAAAAVAESLNINQIIVGFNIEEAQSFPDNSVEFLKKITDSLFYSTANHVQVSSYTAELNKTEIVTKLRLLSRPFPFEKIWSCYDGGDKPCGVCESCKRFLRAINLTTCTIERPVI
ncbi:MAG: 7-cyano-7-deazaguanine synthase QueC [Deltaproteobacteria bacterium]|nr:7-cyano-7-deazaguanine synthase QueC [Deltaproteobacteria bacterium]